MMRDHDRRRSPDGGRSSGPLLQRQCACGGTCGDCARKESLQRRTANGAPAHDDAPAVVHDVLQSQGRPLDAATRRYMEPRFGHDFSRVRVHTGDKAARSASAVGALAYTVGQNVVFRDGAPSLASREGKSLLAHELAHTVQQSDAGKPDGALPVGKSDSAAEHDAHAMATAAAAGRAGTAARGQPAQVARATRPFLLTFDDGPDGVNKLGTGKNLTEKVLDTLCAKGVGAAFFVQTAAVNKDTKKPHRGSTPIGQALIKRMDAEGHQIGIHTGGKIDHELHPTAQAAGRLSKELSDAKSALKATTGKTPTMVRPPTGASNKAVRATYKKLGLSNVLWDIDGDAGAKSLDRIKKNIKANLKTIIARGWTGTTPLAPTIVALFHDVRPNTASHVGDIIDFIKSEVSAQTGGKDTVSFPAISCKAAGKGDGDGGSDGGRGDYELPTDSGTRVAEAQPADAPEEATV